MSPGSLEALEHGPLKGEEQSPFAHHHPSNGISKRSQACLLCLARRHSGSEGHDLHIPVFRNLSEGNPLACSRLVPGPPNVCAREDVGIGPWGLVMILEEVFRFT